MWAVHEAVVVQTLFLLLTPCTDCMLGVVVALAVAAGTIVVVVLVAVVALVAVVP